MKLIKQNLANLDILKLAPGFDLRNKLDHSIKGIRDQILFQATKNILNTTHLAIMTMINLEN